MSKRAASAASASAARRIQVVMIGMAMTLLAAISLSAWAQPAPPPAMGERGPGMGFQQRGEHGPGMDEHGWGGMRHGMGGMHGGMHGGMGGGMGGGMMFRGSPERMGRMIDHMLDGLNASDAQRSQIKQIAAAVGADMKAQAEAGRALRQRGMQAFVAPNVDAAAVEQVRQQMLQQHDQMSRRMTQAMLDVARVLTPEQRARLGERMRDRQARMQDRIKRMESMRQAMPPRR
ncbi:MAG: Spy/CpxP family protein refolding chaperone [Caldimonas sp.]